MGYFFVESFHPLMLLPIGSPCLTLIIFVIAKHLESEFVALPEIESESGRLRAMAMDACAGSQKSYEGQETRLGGDTGGSHISCSCVVRISHSVQMTDHN